ncbi:MAG: sporulation protein [Proteobacteria bacterium]|nr:sporulation protein [Pseudomonadota bacterium]
MRILLTALVLANGLYFAWSHGALAAFGWLPASYSEREPQRLENQVRPGALQVKPAASSSPAPQSAR